VNPKFIHPDHVLAIHSLHLDQTGGSEGIRDLGLLDSALSQPAASFGGDFLHEDIFAMAAAYLFHVVKNHPFVDGNKRTGLAVALTFLEVNGVLINRPSSILEDSTLSVAENSMSKEDLAEVLRNLAIRSDED